MTQNSNTSSFYKQLHSILQPGDILNFYSFPVRSLRDFFKYGYINIVSRLIQREARSYFGAHAETRHFHTQLFFDAEHILNIIFPRNRWDTLADISTLNFSIYRVQHANFTSQDAQWMVQKLEQETPYTTNKGKSLNMKVIGSYYDLGDLLDFMVNNLLGNHNTIKHHVFDFSKKHKVCSTGSAIVLETLRQKALQEQRPTFNPLFQSINKEAFMRWSPNGKSIVSEYNANPVVSFDSIRPAFYANTSNYFQSEISKIAEVQNGRITEVC